MALKLTMTCGPYDRVRGILAEDYGLDLASVNWVAWGFQRTRAEIDKMLSYALMLGMVDRKYDPADLFHPSTWDT